MVVESETGSRQQDKTNKSNPKWLIKRNHSKDQQIMQSQAVHWCDEANEMVVVMGKQMSLEIECDDEPMTLICTGTDR